MTQIRMCVRVCQHNTKTQQDSKQVMVSFAAIFKKKNVIWKKRQILKLYPSKKSYYVRWLRENLILLQANNNKRRSDCAVQTAHKSVEIITDNPTSIEISILHPVSVAEQAGLTLTKCKPSIYVNMYLYLLCMPSDISRCLLSADFFY